MSFQGTHRLGAASICVAAIVALGGCGGGGNDEGDDPQQVAEEYVTASNDQDFDRICDLYADEFKELIGASGANCASFVKEQTTGSGQPSNLSVGSVSEDGDFAEVHLSATSEGGQPIGLQMQLHKDDEGDWKIFALQPVGE